MSEDTPNTQLPVLQNRAPQEMVVAQRVSALSKLFQLKPKTLELVSKSTQQEGAEPGTFRITSTNEKFKELRVVILFEPLEQREKYRKGAYSKDSKECFSLDNVQPHPKARTPYALYCANCPMGDLNWAKYREAKAKGITGEALSAYLPPCRKFWHLFIATRETQRPLYFNVKGLGVSSFEDGMQNVADLFQMIYQNIKAENKVTAAANAKAPADAQAPLKTLPETVADVIWHISFTMYAKQINGGQWFPAFKDFKVMSEEDRADFGKIIEEVKARREAGKLQSQEASEQEEEAAALTGQPAGSGVRQAEVVSVQTNEVAEKNKQIQI
jgi:uncharacterized damage-inducible protein DinB